MSENGWLVLILPQITMNLEKSLVFRDPRDHPSKFSDLLEGFTELSKAVKLMITITTAKGCRFKLATGKEHRSGSKKAGISFSMSSPSAVSASFSQQQCVTTLVEYYQPRKLPESWSSRSFLGG